MCLAYQSGSSSIVEIVDGGAQGVMESTLFDYNQSCQRAEELCGYASERELAIADEHRRETEIFQKVLAMRRGK